MGHGANDGRWQFVPFKQGDLSPKGKGKGKGKGLGKGHGDGEHGREERLYFTCRSCKGYRDARWPILERCKVCGGAWSNKREVMEKLEGRTSRDPRQVRQPRGGREGEGPQGAGAQGGRAQGRGKGSRENEDVSTGPMPPTNGEGESSRVPQESDVGICVAAVLAHVDRLFGDRMDVAKALEGVDLTSEVAKAIDKDRKSQGQIPKPKSKRAQLGEARAAMGRASQEYQKALKDQQRLDKAEKDAMLALEKAKKEARENRDKEERALEARTKATEEVLRIKAMPDEDEEEGEPHPKEQPEQGKGQKPMVVDDGNGTFVDVLLGRHRRPAGPTQGTGAASASVAGGGTPEDKEKLREAIAKYNNQLLVLQAGSTPEGDDILIDIRARIEECEHGIGLIEKREQDMQRVQKEKDAREAGDAKDAKDNQGRNGARDGKGRNRNEEGGEGKGRGRSRSPYGGRKEEEVPVCNIVGLPEGVAADDLDEETQKEIERLQEKLKEVQAGKRRMIEEEAKAKTAEEERKKQERWIQQTEEEARKVAQAGVAEGIAVPGIQ